MRASDSTSHSLYSSRLTFVQNFRFKKAAFGPSFLLIIFISKLLCFGNLSTEHSVIEPGENFRP
jgi:hypothetical protein